MQGNREAATHIVVGGGNGSGNRGDEIMWDAAARVIRSTFPDAPLVTDGPTGWVPPRDGVEVLPNIHQAVRRLRRVPRHRVETAVQVAVNRGSVERGLRRITRLRDGAAPRRGVEAGWDEAIRRSRAVVVAGSGALTDPHALRSVVGWGMLTAMAVRHSVPVAYLGQGVGPLESPMLRDAVGRTLDDVALVTVRDQQSVEVVRSINPRRPVLATADWALLAPPDEAHRRAAAELVEHHVGSEPFVALSLRRYRSADSRALRALHRITERIVDLARARGHRVLMVPNVVSTVGFDDRDHMAEVRERLGADAREVCHVVTHDARPQVLRAVLGRSRGVFSTRYHPVVFALAEGAPATGMALDDYYTQKLRGALAWYDEADRAVTLGDDVDGIGDGWVERGFTSDEAAVQRRRATTTELSRQASTPFVDWLTSIG